MQSFEIKYMGIYNSKISQSGVCVSNRRKVSLFEFELPIENGGISYVDSESCRVTTNLFICAKPNQVRHTQFPLKCNFVKISVFDDNLRDAILKLPTFFKIQDRTEYMEIFDELQRYSAIASQINEIMKQSLILKLIYKLCAEAESKSNTKKWAFPINKVIDYIENNPASDLSLESLARQAAMSPVHFHNCFKAATGKTLHEFVEERRMRKAVNLMLGTNMTLTEVAYACGFSSQSYFSYAFKRKMNMTPRNYVRLLSSGYEN